jgi:hypothetical protein
MMLICMILINLGGTMNTMKYQVVEAREDGSVDEEVREGGSNGNAQQLGDKPFFKERRRVDHLGLGPACVVALGWIRGAASNGEKASKNNRTEQPWLVHILYLSSSSSPPCCSSLPQIPLPSSCNSLLSSGLLSG